MFRSRRSFNPYYGKRRRRRIAPVWIALSIPLILLFLELLTRILVGIVGQSSEFSAYEGEPADFSAYRLKFLNEQEQIYDGLSNRGSLMAKKKSFVSYQLAGKQENQFWQINEQGFRDQDPVPLAKPKDEIRIFLLGGSTAFGQGNENNAATIASKLETRLNERIAQQKRSPDKYRPDILSFYRPERRKALALPPKIRSGKYRVINAAVPGYASGNQLAQLALQIFPYKPDLILVLDGYPDLLLSSDETAVEIPHLEDFLNNAPGHFGTYLTQPIKQTIQNTYLVKAVQYWMLKPEPTLGEQSLALFEQDKTLIEHLPGSSEELELRLKRYQNNHKQMLRLCTGAGIPLIFALQPEITGFSDEHHGAQEKEIHADLNSEYVETMESYYPQFAQVNTQLEKSFPKNTKAIDFYTLLAKLVPQGEAFFDTVHLTEKANGAIAQQLYHTITSLPKIQIIPKNFDI